MRSFQFTHSLRDGLHRYVHSPGDQVIVEKPNSAMLMSEWSSTGATPYTEYAVNNNNTEEVAVYLGLISQLTSDLSVHAIPNYYRDDAAKLLRKEFTPVRWEYEVDAEATDPAQRDKGFVRARSCGPRTPYEEEHGDRAGLFRINEFRELVGLMHAVLGDASAEVTFFALARDARVADLCAHLDHIRRPELSAMLGPGDLFIDLTVGVDLGYYDSVLIVSRDDLGARLEPLVARYAQALALYESRVDETRTVEAMLNELAALVAAEA